MTDSPGAWVTLAFSRPLFFEQLDVVEEHRAFAFEEGDAEGHLLRAAHFGERPAIFGPLSGDLGVDVAERRGAVGATTAKLQAATLVVGGLVTEDEDEVLRVADARLLGKLLRVLRLGDEAQDFVVTIFVEFSIALPDGGRVDVAVFEQVVLVIRGGRGDGGEGEQKTEEEAGSHGGGMLSATGCNQQARSQRAFWPLRTGVA